jgi:hypothetical protein
MGRKPPFVVTDHFRTGGPESSDLPWHTVRFAREPSPEDRERLAGALEEAVSASGVIARDDRGEAPLRWSGDLAILPLSAADPELDWQSPGYGAWLAAAEKVLVALHAVVPILEVHRSEEPSGGEVDPEHEAARERARIAIAAASSAPRARTRRGPTKPAAGLPAGFRLAPDAEGPPLERVPAAIARRFEAIEGAIERAGAWYPLHRPRSRGRSPAAPHSRAWRIERRGRSEWRSGARAG